MILSILLTTTTSKAEVRDIYEIAPCLENCDLIPDWRNFLLIEEVTLKSMKSDADGSKKCKLKLKEAQKKHEDDIESLNERNTEIYALKIDNKLLRVRVYELEGTPWYWHPATWGIGGFAVGVTLVAILVGSFK